MSPDTAVAPCDRAPTVQTAVQQTTALWAATDLDGVIAAARTLLRDIAPGTRIRHGTRRVGPWPVGDDTHQFQVDLPRDGVLLVSAPKALSPGMVQPLVDAIQTRVDALGKQAVLDESVTRLARSERLQRALYAIADQASPPARTWPGCCRPCMESSAT